jgi:acetyltransferase
MKEFSHTFTARLTQLDYARAMALVATDPATGDFLGVVRLHSDSRYESAEYAILLRSDLKGKGLGWALMQLLIDYARSEGLRSLSGVVLRENTAMLTMCRELGFEVTSDPTDASLAKVFLDLAARQAERASIPD